MPTIILTGSRRTTSRTMTPLPGLLSLPGDLFDGVRAVDDVEALAPTLPGEPRANGCLLAHVVRVADGLGRPRQGLPADGDRVAALDGSAAIRRRSLDRLDFDHGGVLGHDAAVVVLVHARGEFL